ncbi:MAG: DNA adenine methylase [Thalassobaculales bacterium]
MSEESIRFVRPVTPAAPWMGGKRNLARRLVAMIQAVPHTIYAEPFVGMGGVFLRRSVAAKCEVINDLSRDVSGFFRVLQRHYQALMDELKWRLTSRDEFERLRQLDPDTLTDLERAARFLYLQSISFGGKVRGRTFGVTYGAGGRFDTRELGPRLAAIHERLAGVIIERLPWRDVLARYDRPSTLFYLDPPYWRHEHDYGPGLFDRSEFATLATALRALQGRFILSINDVAEIREMFSWAAIQPVEVAYSAGYSGGRRKVAAELIISSPP